MNKKNESTKLEKKLDQLKSKLSRNEILNQNSLKRIRGGEGEDVGGTDIIIIPKPK